MTDSEEKIDSVAAGAVPGPAGHTPTPWRLRIVPGMGPDGEPYWYINAKRGARAGMPFPDATCVVDPECGILSKEDAAFIVLAANAHHGLVEALEEVQALIGVTMGEGPEATIPETVPTRLGIPVRAADIMRAVDAALALAKED